MLLRHARAATPAMTADIDRPLAAQGRQAAAALGAYLARENLLPDLTLCSPATRARQTWELARAELARAHPGEAFPAALAPQIYEGGRDGLLHALQDDHPARTLLAVGHNRGIAALARALVSHGDRYAFARLSQKFPPGALAVIDLDVSHWAEIAGRSGRLDRFVTPHALDPELEDVD